MGLFHSCHGPLSFALFDFGVYYSLFSESIHFHFFNMCFCTILLFNITSVLFNVCSSVLLLYFFCAITLMAECLTCDGHLIFCVFSICPI